MTEPGNSYGDFFTLIKLSIGFLVALILFCLFGVIPINSWEAHKVGIWLSSIEQPPQSQLLRRVTDVGNFASAGNQCDFAAAEVRSTELTKVQLNEFYAKRIDESNKLTSMRTFDIFYPDETDSYPYQNPFRDLLEEYAHSLVTGTLYLAVAIDGPHEAGLDYRCH